MSSRRRPPTTTPLRVAVVGAGAAGLVALRHLTAAGPEVFQPIAFEQTDSVGGTWVYTDDVGWSTDGLPIHTSMYRNMRTNLPKEVMAFPDYPFDQALPSFMRHEDVLNYLKNYAQHFDLLPFIEFSTVVEHVKPIHPVDSCSPDVTWEVTVRKLQTSADVTDVRRFDAVIVCSGHYAVPDIPDNIGLTVFDGRVVHSHDYREPSSFNGRDVIVLGAGPSGIDIAVEIAPLCNQLHLCHKGEPLHLLPIIRQHPGIVEMTSDGAILENGEQLTGIDTVLLCTGYKYRFPFLKDDCQITVNDEDKHVYPLYLHLIHARLPTLSFVGIPTHVCPFPLFDRQVQLVVAYLLGAIDLPTGEEMEKQAGCRANDIGFHDLGPAQWAYNQTIEKMIGIEALDPVVEQLYTRVGAYRKQDVLGYKDQQYRIIDKNNFIEL